MMHDTHSQLRQLSTQDFASFGLGDVAYVRPVEMDGAAAFAIHAADGTPLSVVADRELAFAAIVQNDMEPVSVH
ncbi:DUF1150 family protein [Azospirillum sp. 11R-A]|uniref:DUF1150 domain-containing protein n=1 Tax=Azospirillum palustre TaxID=2044885 RepID=A0A2B8B5K7_9PROT|nr:MULTISPECIES: DUF1150 family protein [Azospirillum]PGH53090.1 hypothetical protein CRT60_24540 [Azospirillum palustre]PWC47696.1 hypothetical protein TSA6c_14195 [Azospirillum sp. TSA6c]